MDLSKIDPGTLRRLVVFIVGMVIALIGDKLTVTEDQQEMVVHLIMAYLIGSNIHAAAKHVGIKKAEAITDTQKAIEELKKPGIVPVILVCVLFGGYAHAHVGDAPLATPTLTQEMKPLVTAFGEEVKLDQTAPLNVQPVVGGSTVPADGCYMDNQTCVHVAKRVAACEGELVERRKGPSPVVVGVIGVGAGIVLTTLIYAIAGQRLKLPGTQP